MSSYKCNECGIVHHGEHDEIACSEKHEDQERKLDFKLEYGPDNPEPYY